MIRGLMPSSGNRPMIDLFNINHYQIDTSKFSNLLHDKIVNEFEHEFAEYVGAKYACSANSASSLLFIALKNLNTTIKIPSIIPAVVPNVVCNTGNRIEFDDNVNWVGHAYKIHDNIIDSAQEVTKNQYKNLSNPNMTMIFSFYPTKPVGSCDGGMIVSDNKDLIEYYRTMTMNGMGYKENNWERKQTEIGYKMHCTSIQAYIACKNLRKLDQKNDRLNEVRNIYNKNLQYNNTSNHLYRIRVPNNRSFIKSMKKLNIVCGIHYEACHLNPCYASLSNHKELPLSTYESSSTVSIPFHDKLTQSDIKTVIKTIQKL